MNVTFSNDAMKVLIAKKGPTKVFGEDVDHREQLSDPEAVTWFDERWEGLIVPALAHGKPCSLESVREKVPYYSQRFIRDDLDHKEFRLHGCHFICQFTAPNECDQLWFIPSTSADPRLLYVKFENIPIRKEFDAVAKQLNWVPEKLAEKILLDFMETVTHEPRLHDQR